MRAAIAACVAVLASCGSDEVAPSLRITPGDGGAMTISAPTVFSATLVNLRADDVAWTVTGGGSLSSTRGLHVTYVPPLGTSTAALTATAHGVTATVQITAQPAELTPATIAHLTAPVTIQYDAQDIPHIQCAVARDCYAAQGYAQARDRLFPLDFVRRIATSRLAELIGVDGLAQDVQLRTLFVTRAGERLEVALARVMDGDTKAKVAAFADGVNAYLAEARARSLALPGEYAQLPFAITIDDIPAWTVEDTIAVARLQQFTLSETLNKESTFGRLAAAWSTGALADQAKILTWIRAAAPATERAHTLSPGGATLSGARTSRARAVPSDLAGWRDVLDATAEQTRVLRDSLLPGNASTGSNNWAIAASKSATNTALLANDPHLALQYPPLFHLSVLTSATAADHLDLAGGTFPGIPGALLGRGQHVSWGVTVTGYDVTDLYLEQFAPPSACPTPAPCVVFRGGVVSTIAVPQTFRVRTAGGLVDGQTLPAASRPPAAVLVVPHHGPIIQAPDAGGKAVSARWTGHEGNTHDVKALLALDTAVDVDAAIAALEGFATGAQNFVLADDAGHIAYDPHALVPVRAFADSRVNGSNVRQPWFPLPGDGSGISMEWGGDPAVCATATDTPVPASCWLTDAELPHAKDPAKGYLFSANADPTWPSVSDDNDPLAHPPYLSFDWVDSTGFRATRIEERIEALLANGGKVSLDDIRALQTDHASRPGRLFGAAIAALPASSDPALTAARAVLEQWGSNGWDCPSGLRGTDPASPVDPDPVVVQNSAGCFLFHAFLRQLINNVFADDLALVRIAPGENAIKPMAFLLDEASAGARTFCNDVSAAGTLVTPRTCTEQVAIALGQAYATLVAQVGPSPSDWVWGRVHTVTPVSQLALVTTNYAPGPYARPGGISTVDLGTPKRVAGPGLDFAYATGPNVRHLSVMDAANPIMKMQLPGPERDVPSYIQGPDLLGQWASNTYFDFAVGAQIDQVSVAIQHVDPAP